MSKTRAFVLNVLFPLILVAIIFLFVRMSIASREIGTLQKQIAELREAASSTFEQTIRRFDEFDHRLGELASFSKKRAPAAPETQSNLASATPRPKTHAVPTRIVSHQQRDERREQEIKLKRDLLQFSRVRSRVCENRANSKLCDDRMHLLAAQGNSAAQEWLGAAARDKQNPQLAVFWLDQAANQGDCAAMNKLGAMYAGSDQQSSGSSHDDLVDATKALSWYGKSASLGDVSAMGAIANIYQEGRLVPQNQSEAIEWYEFASKASMNNGTGPTNFAGVLGDIYSKGTGANQDKIQAYQWYAIACADAARWNVAGDESCTSRSRAGSELSPVEAAKAQALAVEWEKLYRQAAWVNRRRPDVAAR